jgi:hypothetical protein
MAWLVACDVDKQSSNGLSTDETQSLGIRLIMNHNGNGKNSYKRLVYTPVEEAPLEIENLSPCELLMLEAAVRVLTDYLLSLPQSITNDAGVDGLGENRYNLDNGRDDSNSGVGQNSQDDLDADHKTEPTSAQRIAFSAHE